MIGAFRTIIIAMKPLIILTILIMIIMIILIIIITYVHMCMTTVSDV